MKRSYKMILYHVGGVLLLSGLLALLFQVREAFLIALGAVSVVVGTADLFIALILRIAGNFEWAKLFLLAAGVLFLLGIGICGPMFMLG